MQTRIKRLIKGFSLFLLLAAAGCGERKGLSKSFQLDNYDYVNPLATQQRSLYPQARQGRFVSLADFEKVSTSTDQSEQFSINLSHGNISTALSLSATGAASLAVKLPVGGRLLCDLENSWRLDPYTLLQVAVHIDHSRDDFSITLKSDTETLLQSRPKILHSGWNSVTVDISQLKNDDPITSKRLKKLEFTFTQSEQPVEFHLDDILLIDNRHVLTNTPENVTVSRHGQNFRISLFGLDAPLELKADNRGLFILDGLQPELSLQSKAYKAQNDNDISLMGGRNISTAEIVESNSCFVHLKSTWFFPSAHGLWIDLDVRRITWDYIFFGDGRVLISLLINNAGGAEIDSAQLKFRENAIWPDGKISNSRNLHGFEYTVVESSAMCWPTNENSHNLACGYATPGELSITTGSVIDEFTSTYNHKSGLYTAKADDGNFRAILRPQGEKIVRPIFKIYGKFGPKAAFSCNGLAAKRVLVYDGYVLALVDEVISREAILELRGTAAR